MGDRVFKILITGICFIAVAATVKAQAGLCPPNLDFERGNFTGWTCRIGRVELDTLPPAPIGGINTIKWDLTSTTPVQDRHTMIGLTTAGVDTYGGFPRICPNGSGYSVKLGNETAQNSGGIGLEASGVSYSFTIPATANTYSISYYYAVVLELPNHPEQEQPRFRANIRDLTTGERFPCVSFDFIASSSLGGFAVSPVDPNVLYKDWTPVTVDLSGLAGRTIEIEFIATECTRKGHFAYAFVDVNSNCNGAIRGSTICQGEPDITLNAPFGYQHYEWFSDMTFSTSISNNLSVYLNPAPAVGSLLPVIVDPYPGFGCKDTLYADITVSPKPVSVAGEDKMSCNYRPVQIGGPSNPIHMYEWTPSSPINNPILSNPTVWNVGTAPSPFIVKTTDVLTGCFSTDEVVVTNYIVDTAMGIAGSLSFCIDEPSPVLSVNSSFTDIQWHHGSSPITGADGATYVPTVSGSYWAQFTQGICTDTTRQVLVKISKPVPGITYRSITVPEGSSSYLHARPVGNTYNWTPQQQLSYYDRQYTEFFAVGDDVRYIIDITDPNGCTTVDTVLMQILKKPGYYLPTAFTPNGDGLNDIVTPFLIGMKGLKSFSIYNRWGTIIFFSTTLGVSWDGRYKGLLQENGVYVWSLQYYDTNDKLILQKGTITLIK